MKIRLRQSLFLDAQPKDSFWYFVFAIVVLLVFGQSLSFSLLSWDDTFHICQNPNFYSADRSLLSFWDSDFLGLYAPLTYTIWGVAVGFARLIFGENSNCSEWGGIFHGLNMLIHLMNTILVYEVLKIIANTPNKKYAAFGALLFALHPIQVETVAWISAGRDLMSFLFGICGILLAMKDRWKLATVFLVAGCLAKATGVVFPLLILVILVQQNRYKDTARFIPSLLAALCFSIFAKFLQPDTALNFISPLWQRPFIFAHNLGFYFYKFFVPVDLAPDYTRSIESLNQNPSLFWPIGVFIVVSIILYLLRRFQGLLSLTLITIAVLPVSGLIPFGFEETSTVADRYFYVAMFGVALLTTNLLSSLQYRQISKWAPVILLIFSVLSFRQVQHWADDETLFSYNLGIFPASTISHQAMADIYFAKGDYQSSLYQIQQVLNIRPPNSMIIVKAGRALENLGRVEEAEKLYSLAIEKNIKSTEIFNNLGKIYFIKGQMQLAEKFWIASTKESATNFEPQFNLGILYLSQGKFQDSLGSFLKAKNISPQHPFIDGKIQEVKSKIE